MEYTKIEILIPKRDNHNPESILEKIADILEETLNESESFDGETLSTQLHIDDCVLLLTCEGFDAEVTL